MIKLIWSIIVCLPPPLLLVLAAWLGWALSTLSLMPVWLIVSITVTALGVFIIAICHSAKGN